MSVDASVIALLWIPAALALTAFVQRRNTAFAVRAIERWGVERGLALLHAKSRGRVQFIGRIGYAEFGATFVDGCGDEQDYTLRVNGHGVTRAEHWPDTSQAALDKELST